MNPYDYVKKCEANPNFYSELVDNLAQDAAKNNLGRKRQNDISRRVREMIDLEEDGNNINSTVKIWNQANELDLNEDIEMMKKDKQRLIKEHAEEIEKLKQKHIQEVENLKEEMTIECVHCLSPIKGFIVFSCSKCFYSICHNCQITHFKALINPPNGRRHYCECENKELGFTQNNFSSSSIIGKSLSKQNERLITDQDRTFVNHLEVLSKTICTFFANIISCRSFRISRKKLTFLFEIELDNAGIDKYKIELEPTEINRRIKIIWYSHNMVFHSYEFKMNSLYTNINGINAMIRDGENIDSRTDAIIKLVINFKNVSLFSDLDIFDLDNINPSTVRRRNFVFQEWKIYLREQQINI